VFFSKTLFAWNVLGATFARWFFGQQKFCFLGDVPKLLPNIMLAGKLIVLIPSWMKRTVAVFPANRWTLLISVRRCTLFPALNALKFNYRHCAFDLFHEIKTNAAYSKA
jgi:hypothetical protein